MPNRKPAAPPKRTEAQLLELLALRHGESGGNGDAFAFVTHVRNAAGHQANRTIDAMAWGLWPSRGLLVDAFEVKCSRADWLRELKDPAKADAFADCADRFWIVAANGDVVKDGELPEGWGLLVARGTGTNAKLGLVTAATMLRPHPGDGFRPLPPGMDRSFLAAFARAACRADTKNREREIKRRVDDIRAGDEHDAARTREHLQQVRETLLTFERQSGIRLHEWDSGENAAKLGDAVRLLLQDDGSEHLAMALERNASHMERAAQTARLAAQQAREARPVTAETAEVPA